jgi:hypothetical protein
MNEKINIILTHMYFLHSVILNNLLSAVTIRQVTNYSNIAYCVHNEWHFFSVLYLCLKNNENISNSVSRNNLNRTNF